MPELVCVCSRLEHCQSNESAKKEYCTLGDFKYGVRGCCWCVMDSG